MRETTHSWRAVSQAKQPTEIVTERKNHGFSLWFVRTPFQKGNGRGSAAREKLVCLGGTLF